jgi:hypothetical protein
VSQSHAAAPHGMIDLVDCVSVKVSLTLHTIDVLRPDFDKYCSFTYFNIITLQSAETKARRRNALEVSTNDETYLMFAETEKEKDDWIGAIGRCVIINI